MKEIDIQKIYKEILNAFVRLAEVGAPMANNEMIAKTAMIRAVEIALDMVQEKQDQFFSNKDWIENHSDGITDIIQEVKDSIKL